MQGWLSFCRVIGPERGSSWCRRSGKGQEPVRNDFQGYRRPVCLATPKPAFSVQVGGLLLSLGAGVHPEAVAAMKDSVPHQLQGAAPQRRSRRALHAFGQQAGPACLPLL